MERNLEGGERVQHKPVSGVRYSYDTGLFEGRCFDCGRYLPFDREFWYIKRGFGRCKACIDIQHRATAEAKLAAAKADPKAEARRVYQREWKRKRKQSKEYGPYLTGIDPELRAELQRRRNRRTMRVRRVA
jgi:hypothetical protein